jgi:hypothetical protein
MSSHHLGRLETLEKLLCKVEDMRLTNWQIVGVFFVGVIVGYVACSMTRVKEGFETVPSKPQLPICPSCGTTAPCKEHPEQRGQCPLCPPYPDMSKYVLKSSIPPCPSLPDMSQYMLKTECPSVPDMSQYVLKSSIPKPQPIIVDNSACKKECGDCPPCPRPRCPDVKCPPPTVCPKCPPCPRPNCPPSGGKVVKCRAEPAPDENPVRPFLAPLGMNPFGQ